MDNFNGSTPSNSLMDKFELSFMNCIHSLTKEDSSNGVDKDEIKVEVENTITNFIDLARQMECFFLQKRFQLSCLKPELLLKEENIDLRHEIARKDELLKKHAAKITKWKEFLSDNTPTVVPPQIPPNAGMPPQQMVGPSGVAGPPPPQMQMQMPMQPGFGMNAGIRPGFPPQGMGPTNPTNQNPLAFLEKTTNNIMDMGGPSR